MAGSNDIRRLIERSFEVANTPDDDELDRVLEECYAPDYVVHDPSEPADLKGRDAFREFVATYRSAFPDLQLTIDDKILVQGDMAATRYTITGTHTGELGGIAPTNKRVSVMGMDISRVRDGKVVETWQMADSLSMFQQLGVVPSQEQLLVAH